MGLGIFSQRMRAAYSATGATARPHVSAVSDSLTANEPIRRQLPSRCSKNHSRFSGSRIIQSSKKSVNLRADGLRKIVRQGIASGRVNVLHSQVFATCMCRVGSPSCLSPRHNTMP